MRRIGIVALVLLALLGISQLVIPPIIESRISDRLTAAGGSAHVSVSALPSIRLLFGEGSRIEVTGSGLNLTSQSESGTVFSNLDGYDNVNVNLDHFHAGPFQMASFELTRSGPEAEYHLVASRPDDARPTLASVRRRTARASRAARCCSFFAGTGRCGGNRPSPDQRRHGAPERRRTCRRRLGRRHDRRLPDGPARRADHLGDRGAALVWAR